MKSQTKSKQLILFSKIIAVILVSFLIFVKLTTSYNFDHDFGRDLNDIYSITQGDLRLIGPKLSFGGLHIAPYYYYLFVPALILGKYAPQSLVYFNAVMYLLIFFILILVKKLYLIKSNELSNILASIWIFSSPYFLYSSRSPGNAFSYLGLLLIFFILIKDSHQKNNFINQVTAKFCPKNYLNVTALILGLGAGVIINFHFITAIIILSVMLTELFTSPSKLKEKIIRLLYFAGGMGLAFSPLLLFELKNNFIMLKNTFVYQSYKAFTDNTNLSNPLITSPNPIINMLLLNNHAWDWLPIPVLIQGFFSIYYTFKKQISDKKTRFVVMSATLSFILLSIAARWQFAFHYLFPFLLFIQFAAISVINKWRFSWLILVCLISINILSLPNSKIYQPARRNFTNFTNFIQKFEKSETSQVLTQGTFNVYVLRETPLAVLGHEYRYLLKSQGYKPLPKENYTQADYLLVIQEEEANQKNMNKIQSWELEQFGPKKEIHSEQIGDRIVKIFAKENRKK